MTHTSNEYWLLGGGGCVLHLARYLVLKDTDLQGTLPLALTVLGNLTHLDLSGNSFSGTIPSRLSALSKLK